MAQIHLSKNRDTRWFTRAVLDRVAGPGGLYNLGNLIGLASGIGFALLGTQASGVDGGAVAVLTGHLAGNAGAVALTIAMAVFFASGEMYHQAYTALTSDTGARRLRQADFLSGVGGLFLAVSLVYFGELWLAFTSTVLLCGGKFANALFHPDTGRVRLEFMTPSGTTRLVHFDVFRMAPVLSRLPAMAGLLIALATSWQNPELLRDAPTAILFGCYVLWLKADLLLTQD